MTLGKERVFEYKVVAVQDGENERLLDRHGESEGKGSDGEEKAPSLPRLKGRRPLTGKRLGGMFDSS